MNRARLVNQIINTIALQDAAPPTCGNCKETLPPLYVGRGGNPAILSAVGFSGHGKTVYLASLLHAMNRDIIL